MSTSRAPNIDAGRAPAARLVRPGVNRQSGIVCGTVRRSGGRLRVTTTIGDWHACLEFSFRNRPFTVEAEQFFHNQPFPFRDPGPVVFHHDGHWSVLTIHNHITPLQDADWGIREPAGHLQAYPCQPDIFETIYEPAP